MNQRGASIDGAAADRAPHVTAGSSLSVFPGSALFVSHRVEASVDVHRHHLMKIFVTLDGCFRVLSEGSWREADVVVIAPDVPHRFTDGEGFYAVVYLDGESQAALAVRRERLGDLGMRFLPGTALGEAREHLMRLSDRAAGSEEARGLIDEVVRRLLGPEAPPPVLLDERVLAAIACMERCDDKKARIGEIAREVGLSESRLIHLFTSQVGIPIRRYMLWLRLLDAVTQIMAGSSYTEAAHGAGFSDSAHLSRTFRAMFGLKLTDVFTTTKIAGSFKQP